jgi:hypothetical protein
LSDIHSLSAPERPRELHAAIAEVDLLTRGGRVAQVGRRGAEGALEGGAVAHQQAAGIQGLEQPLVRVDHERVGELEPRQLSAAARRQRGRCTVRAIHVQPQALVIAEAPQRLQRVDCARARGAGRGDHACGEAPRRAVGRHGGGHLGSDQASVAVARQRTNVAAGHAGHAEGLLDRRMGLVGQVDRRARAVRPGTLLERDSHRGEVRRRAAAHEQAFRRRRQTAHLAQPVEHHQLDHCGAGRTQPGAGEYVEAGNERVAQSSDRIAGDGDEAEEAGMVHSQA